MKLLLDTHALLWWLADDDRLGAPARALIEDPAIEVLVSIASLWEIVVKLRVGKLHGSAGDFIEATERTGFTLLNCSTAHFRVLENLPSHHRDPFDHLLIAQAIAEHAIFVSSDRHTPLYPVPFISCAPSAAAAVHS